MPQTFLITGATDGIGLETARRLAPAGHTLLLHGRSREKLDRVAGELRAIPGVGRSETFLADFADLADVARMARDIRANHDRIDVLINNAGVLKTSAPVTADGMDVRFVVNTLAPALLTEALLGVMTPDSRVITLSSAAQASVDLDALSGRTRLADMDAYAQSKLAVTMWSAHMANRHGAAGPVFIAVNPGSLLASKMVKEGFGIAGKDIGIGADILVAAATEPRFAAANGRYFDNDAGDFGPPHFDARDSGKTGAVTDRIHTLIDSYLA
ncbi:MAG: oxidoreductase [Maricaulis sp.]|nr:oxidoreductase [Maricaulis sp.]HAQ34105.1 oxidoreductase [Alphaproteobacteria bacterium]